MPYKSRSQQRYMHAAAARGDVPQSVVDEFDRATKDYSKLPERAPKKRRKKTAFERGAAEALAALGVPKTAADAITRAARG